MREITPEERREHYSEPVPRYLWDILVRLRRVTPVSDMCRIPRGENEEVIGGMSEGLMRLWALICENETALRAAKIARNFPEYERLRDENNAFTHLFNECCRHEFPEIGTYTPLVRKDGILVINPQSIGRRPPNFVSTVGC